MVINPAASAGAAAAVAISNSSADRVSKVTSPTGSAAAMSSSCCVSAGSDWICRRKLCSIWLASGRASGRPKPPASSAARQSPGQLKQGQRVAAGLGDDPVPDPLVESARGSRSRAGRGRRCRSEPDLQLRQPCQTPARGRVRAPRTPARSAPRAGVARRRRAPAPRPVQPLRVVDEAEQRLSSATSASRLSTASPIRKRSGGPRAQAERRRRARRAAGAAGDRDGPATARTTGAARRRRVPSRTRRPPRLGPAADALPHAYSSKADLPMPASPRRTRTELWPACTAATSWSSVAHSRRRPRSRDLGLLLAMGVASRTDDCRA